MNSFTKISNCSFVGAGKVSMELWSVDRNPSLELVKAHKVDGEFYVNESFILLVTNQNIDSVTHSIHYCSGNENSEYENKFLIEKISELDDFLGGGSILYKEIQGEESSLFLSYFIKSGGVKYVPRETPRFSLQRIDSPKSKLPGLHMKPVDPVSLKIYGDTSPKGSTNCTNDNSPATTPSSLGLRLPGLHMKPIDPVSLKIYGDTSSKKGTSPIYSPSQSPRSPVNMSFSNRGVIANSEKVMSNNNSSTELAQTKSMIAESEVSSKPSMSRNSSPKDLVMMNNNSSAKLSQTKSMIAASEVSTKTSMLRNLTPKDLVMINKMSSTESSSINPMIAASSSLRRESSSLSDMTSHNDGCIVN